MPKKKIEKSELFALKWSLDHISLHENVLWFIHEAGWLTRPFRSFIRGRGSGGLPSVKSESKLVLNGWELWTNNWSTLYWEVWNQIKSFPCLSQPVDKSDRVSNSPSAFATVCRKQIHHFRNQSVSASLISARAEDCSCQPLNEIYSRQNAEPLWRLWIIQGNILTLVSTEWHRISKCDCWFSVLHYFVFISIVLQSSSSLAATLIVNVG